MGSPFAQSGLVPTIGEHQAVRPVAKCRPVVLAAQYQGRDDLIDEIKAHHKELADFAAKHIAPEKESSA